MSSPRSLNSPPQSGHFSALGASVCVSRGRCAGKSAASWESLRLVSYPRRSATLRIRCASIASSTSNSNCSISRARFSLFWPNCMRRNLASSNCRCSISRSATSVARAARRSARGAHRWEERSDRGGDTVCGEYRMNTLVRKRITRKHCEKNLASYTDTCGARVRTGRRESMPSSNIDNCARVRDTVPLPPSATGTVPAPAASRTDTTHRRRTTEP